MNVLLWARPQALIVASVSLSSFPSFEWLRRRAIGFMEQRPPHWKKAN
jgi:hypothetical protein